MIAFIKLAKYLLSALPPQYYIKLKNAYIFIRNANNIYKIKGKDNELSIQGYLNKVNFDILGNNNVIVVNPGTILNKVEFYIRGSNHKIIIGSNCCFTRSGSIWIEDNGCSLTIGDNTSIEEAHIALTEPGSSIEIGKDCMLAYDIDIRCGDSHSIIDLSTGKRINYAKDIKINDHVWIAAHIQILKGVTVGSNSVIATGAVVTKDIPSNSIAAGVPAKVVKTNINWERQRLYDKHR